MRKKRWRIEPCIGGEFELRRRGFCLYFDGMGDDVSQWVFHRGKHRIAVLSKRDNKITNLKDLRKRLEEKRRW